jgi:hypothetical protein
MIIKGSSRASPNQLARHLQRTDTNERVQVLELQSPAGNLTEALRDWQFIATGTQGSKGLYHANIDPDARYTLTAEQWQRAVDVLEKELGLDGQPRVVVMHEKHGREHIHVVWQRTNIDSMTMVPDSFNYVAHERASLALEQEFGHEHVPGKHAKRDREKQPEFPNAEITHAEWQQGERTGIDPRAFKEAVTALYQQSDSGQALQGALEERGLMLAKGDRRDYVIVDDQGQIYSLARQIKGVTAKDLRAFMADIDREAIPSVEQAKALQREAAQKPESRPEPPNTSTAPTPEEIAKLEAALKARHEEEGHRLRDRQQAEYKQTAAVLDSEIASKREDLDALQNAALARYDREHARPEGIARWIEAAKTWLNPAKAAEEALQREEHRAAFVDEQEKQRATKIAALETAKQADLNDLTERHEQQRREHTARFDQELGRYTREHEAAQRLLAEIEERRRQQELDAEQRTRDGPQPPGFTR